MITVSVELAVAVVLLAIVVGARIGAAMTVWMWSP